MKLLVSEDRIGGRRLILRNGKLVVERTKPLDAEIVAQGWGAMMSAAPEPTERKPRRARANAS
jgi:hypothetical protein